MSASSTTLPQEYVSIVIPLFNEEENIARIHKALSVVVEKLPGDFEFIFVNDGSKDRSQEIIEKLAATDERVRFIEFSRNFGKEIATTAGFHTASGHAAIAIDCDLQHPPEMIPEFLDKWRAGADVVVGIRRESKSDSLPKRLGSKWFYRIMNAISDTEIIPHSTDFRLLNRIVLDEFNAISERNRITRGLIDWLGFRRDYVYFDARERQHGEASYGFPKLTKLAVTGFVTYSLLPLRFAGYAGAAIMLLSGTLGFVMLLDRYFTNGGLNFSGTAILADIILFLVGFILVCIGLLAFYIGNIHENTRHRPLYVVRSKKLKA